MNIMICCLILLRMRNVSDMSCRENRSTHFMFCTFFPENHTVYEIVWKSMVRAGQATDDSIIGRMCIECWITKATG